MVVVVVVAVVAVVAVVVAVVWGGASGTEPHLSSLARRVETRTGGKERAVVVHLHGGALHR